MIGLILALVLLSEKTFGGSVRIEDYSFRISPGEKTSSEVIVVNDADDLTGEVDIRVLYDGVCGEGSPGPDALSLTFIAQGKMYPMVGSSSGSFIASGVPMTKGNNEWRIIAVSDPRLCSGSYSSEISFRGYAENIIKEDMKEDIKNGVVSESAGPLMSFSAILSETDAVGSLESIDFSSAEGLLPVSDGGADIRGEDGYIGSIISSIPGMMLSAQANPLSALGKIGGAVKDKLPIVVSSTAFAALTATGLHRRYVKINRDLLS